MKKIIIIEGKKIEYFYRKYRGLKSLRLAINSKGQLVASKPWYATVGALEAFIKTKTTWIIENLAKHPGDRRDDYLLNKERARIILTEKVLYWNKFYNFPFNKISIRNSATRWGSCSSKGNLSFSYKTIFLEEKMLDYIVVHELCHLKEMNHSAKFWSLVETKIPDYKQIRKNLKTHGK